MPDVAVGSYPYESLARDIADLLAGEGVPAVIEYAGPRAWQVLVSGEDGPAAGMVLENVGYLACPTEAAMAGASLGADRGSVLDWNPPDWLDPEEVIQEAERELDRLANIQAAMTWSMPDDRDVERFGKVWIIADFDGQIGVNGDHKKGRIPSSPKNYVDTGRGGRISCQEEHVSVEYVARIVAEKMSSRKRKVETADVFQILRKKYGAEEVPVSVSGEADIYAPKSKVRQD